MHKFTTQLPKDDLKKFAKEVGKKLVASDFKNNRVEDPTKISERQEKKVKKYVREYFEKAVEKKKVLERRKREEKGAVSATEVGSNNNDGRVNRNGKTEGVNGIRKEDEVEGDGDGEQEDTMDLTPDSPSILDAPPSPEAQSCTPSPDLSRKRPRDPDPDTPSSESNKRMKEEGEGEETPPPPPPPPPAESMPDAESSFTDNESTFLDTSFEVGTSSEGLGLGIGVRVRVKEETEEQKELRRQEEELMRENEEAMKEEVMLDDGSGSGSSVLISRGGNPAMKEVNGNGVKLEMDSKDGMEGVEMGSSGEGIERKRERVEVGRS
jgi:histone-lysine N-methyltransferase SETD2